MPEISEVIRLYIIDELMNGAVPEELNGTTYLIEEEILDSLGIFSMVTFLETRFAITFEPEDITIDNFETLDAISALVRVKLDGGRVG